MAVRARPASKGRIYTRSNHISMDIRAPRRNPAKGSRNPASAALKKCAPTTELDLDQLEDLPNSESMCSTRASGSQPEAQAFDGWHCLPEDEASSEPHSSDSYGAMGNAHGPLAGGQETSSQRLKRLAPPKQMRRQLSFATETLDEVAAAVREEEPGLEWLEGFWAQVLVKAPPPECKALLQRSFSSWVTAFNRWQAVGDWKPGHAPATMDTYQFQELLSLPMCWTELAHDTARVVACQPLFSWFNSCLSASFFKS